MEIHADGHAWEAGPRQQRHVLAALAVDAGRPLTTEVLIDRVWDEAPSGARRALHVHISRLRRLLGQAGAGGETPTRLVRRSGGYVLDIDTDIVDLHSFQGLVERARVQTSPDIRIALLRDARALWRGEPMTGLTGEWVTQCRWAWRQNYLEATEAWARAHLRVGDAEAVIGVLTDLTGEEPFLESAAALLMRALYATDRGADALQVYLTLRRRMVEELGTDPGPELQKLHQAILRRDVLDPCAPWSRQMAQAAPNHTVTAVAPVPAEVDSQTPDPMDRPTPAQLPADVSMFAGRARELALLCQALTSSPTRDGTGAIATVGGLGGIGKTWLAVRWAHQHKDRFPDGQLFVDLRGFDPSGQIVTPESALRGFLDALGVPPHAIPAHPDAQAGLYRSLVARRRMLVVLDNARDAAHVVDLLPGSPGSAVIVTSRDRLIGLVTQYGAQPVPLDILTTAEAEQVLTMRFGTRIVAPAETVDAVVAACGGLPLALGIAAARAAVLPRPSLAVVAAELRDTTTRLNALDEEHPHSSLRTVMSWSCGALSFAHKQVFALLGAAPGRGFELGAASALTGLSPAQTTAALRALDRQSLINQDAAGRWRMHDLVRLYAAEQAQHLIGDFDRRSALRRLVIFHLHAACAADRQMAPYRLPIPVEGPRPDAVPSFADSTAAVEWMAGEQPNLTAVQQAAMDAGWHAAAWQLAWASDTYLRRRGHLTEHITTWQTGLAAAEQTSDRAATILARRKLASACARLGWHQDAREHMEAAMSAVRQSDDRHALAFVYRTYAQVADLAGKRQEALEHARASLRVLQALDDKPWVATQLNAVGWYSAQLGLYEPARAHLTAALELARELSKADTEANTLDSLGYLAQGTGDHALAVQYYQQGADLQHRNSDTYSEAQTLEHLGDAQAALGDRVAAAKAWRQALRLYRTQRRTSDAERVSRNLHR